jgi:hypothetical protein
VTYYKPEGSPQLLAKNITDRDDLRLPMTAAEFLAQAWRLANDKARELGRLNSVPIKLFGVRCNSAPA